MPTAAQRLEAIKGDQQRRREAQLKAELADLKRQNAERASAGASAGSTRASQSGDPRQAASARKAASSRSDGTSEAAERETQTQARRAASNRSETQRGDESEAASAPRAAREGTAARTRWPRAGKTQPRGSDPASKVTHYVDADGKAVATANPDPNRIEIGSLWRIRCYRCKAQATRPTMQAAQSAALEHRAKHIEDDRRANEEPSCDEQ